MPCSKIVNVFSIASAYLLPRASTFSFASLAWFTATSQSTLRFTVGFYFDRRAVAVYSLAVDDQTGNSQTFSIQSRNNAHRFVGVVIDNA